MVIQRNFIIGIIMYIFIGTPIAYGFELSANYNGFGGSGILTILGTNGKDILFHKLLPDELGVTWRMNTPFSMVVKAGMIQPIWFSRNYGGIQIGIRKDLNLLQISYLQLSINSLLKNPTRTIVLYVTTRETSLFKNRTLISLGLSTGFRINNRQDYGIVQISDYLRLPITISYLRFPKVDITLGTIMVVNVLNVRSNTIGCLPDYSFTVNYNLF